MTADCAGPAGDDGTPAVGWTACGAGPAGRSVAVALDGRAVFAVCDSVPEFGGPKIAIAVPLAMHSARRPPTTSATTAPVDSPRRGTGGGEPYGQTGVAGGLGACV